MVLNASLSSQELNSIYNQCMAELNEWYEFDWHTNRPKVFVIDDEDTFIRLQGKSSKSYIIAFSDYCENIYIKSERLLKGHQMYGDEGPAAYKNLLKHEIDHKYISVYSKRAKLPIWLVESNAIYVSEQYKFMKKPVKFSSFLEQSNKMESKESYLEVAHITNLLIKKVGKDKYLEFLRNVGERGNFVQYWEEVFNLKLEYNSFNSLIT